MNKIGNKGKGESVWLGFFLYNILTRFIEIIDYVEEKNAQIKNINKDMSIGFEINIGANENINKIKNECKIEIDRTKPTQIGEWNDIDYEKLKVNSLKKQVK